MQTEKAAENWRLVSVAGPQPAALELIPTRTRSIGRRTYCDLFLDDRHVSREHARLEYLPEGKDDGRDPGWYLTDTDSRHGTRLNTHPLEPGQRYRIKGGDLIDIRPWSFQVIDPGADLDSSIVGTRDDSQNMATSAITRIESRGGEVERERLELLLNCAQTIHDAENESAVAEAVVDAGVSGTGFANIAVIRPPRPDGRVEVLAGRGALSDGGAGRFSRSLIARAAEGEAVRLQRAAEAEVSGTSLAELGIERAICVPLLTRGSLVGFLYLDHRSGEVGERAQRDAAPFAVGLARLASLSFSHVKRLELQQRMTRIEADLKAASEAQRWVLPAREGGTGPIRYIGESRPGRMVGGDFFDAIALDDDRMLITLGDVSGKGVGASVLMTAAQGFLHARAARLDRIEQVVNDLNAFITARRSQGTFLTLWAGLFDAQQGMLRYVDAGHGYAARLPGDGRPACMLHHGGGPPVGIHHATKYDAAETPWELDDRVVVVSDGIIEQPAVEDDGNGRAVRFSFDGVLGALMRATGGGDEIASIFHAVTRHAQSERLADDATALLIRRITCE